MFNGIAEAVSGKQYDSPPYQLIAKHDGEVSLHFFFTSIHILGSIAVSHHVYGLFPI